MLIARENTPRHVDHFGIVTMQYLAATELMSIGAHVFYKQAESLKQIGEQLDDEFVHAIQLIHQTQGRVVISGMGKSGHIGGKIAATFASTGTPSFFVHPAEAFHGDLGMITAQDTVILLSNSGNTDEVVRLIPYLQARRIPMIAICSNRESALGQAAQVFLQIHIEREVCPNNLAPTTSTTATLAMGDALAVALMHVRQFKAQDFAQFHPGGALGRLLLSRVQDVMNGHIPTVNPDDPFDQVIRVMMQGGVGAAVVMAQQHVVGVVDQLTLEYALAQSAHCLPQLQAAQMMRAPIFVQAQAKLSDAERLFEQCECQVLVVLDARRQLVGVLKAPEL